MTSATTSSWQWRPRRPTSRRTPSRSSLPSPTSQRRMAARSPVRGHNSRSATDPRWPRGTRSYSTRFWGCPRTFWGAAKLVTGCLFFSRRAFYRVIYYTFLKFMIFSTKQSIKWWRRALTRTKQLRLILIFKLWKISYILLLRRCETWKPHRLSQPFARLNIWRRQMVCWNDGNDVKPGILSAFACLVRHASEARKGTK